jgi:electron transport complex protein RnfC
MSDIIQQCGGNPKTLSRLIMGGPMMGVALHSDEAPIIKTTNCILVSSVIGDVPIASRQTQALPCIRCGACTEVCPIGLLPHQLYWYARAKDFDKVQDYHLFDCIECGCCDYVCPSQIPLVQFYRFAKSSIWQQDREKALSDVARQRHEFRLERLAREKREREERHKQKRAEVSPQTDTDKKKQAIQAAMARAREKREQQGILPKNVDNLNDEQRRLIQEVDNRRAANRKNRIRQRDDSAANESTD